MKFCFTHCVKGQELFRNFDFKGRIGLTKYQYKTLYGSKNGFLFCSKVLACAFYFIFKDIIENNVTFKLPLFGARKAEIHMVPVVGKELTDGIKAGKFRKLDPFASDFTGYKMVMTFDKKAEKCIKTITLTSELSALMYDKINSGKKYF